MYLKKETLRTPKKLPSNHSEQPWPNNTLTTIQNILCSTHQFFRKSKNHTLYIHKQDVSTNKKLDSKV